MEYMIAIDFESTAYIRFEANNIAEAKEKASNLCSITIDNNKIDTFEPKLTHVQVGYVELAHNVA